MRAIASLILTGALAATCLAQVAAPPAAPAPPSTPAPATAPRAKPYKGSRTYVMGDTPAAYIAGSKTSYLGVDINDVTGDRISSLKLKDEHGVEITMVDKDAPAGKVGLREHDVILDFNGQRVEGEEQFRRILRETPPGREVTLGISRDGQYMPVKVTLAQHKNYVQALVAPGDFKWPDINMPAIPDIDVSSFEVVTRNSTTSMGASMESLTPQLGEFFGTRNGEGMLVRSVEKGSPAEVAGLKAGDVIVKVDDHRIVDRGDLRNALRRKSGKVSLGILRDKRETTLTVNLPEAPKRGKVFYVPDSDDEDVWWNIEPLARSQALEAQRAALAQVHSSMPLIRESVRESVLTSTRVATEAQREVQRAMREMQRSLRDVCKENEKEKEKE